MEKERQRKSDWMFKKGSKMNLHHFGLILQLRVIPNCQKPPLDVYLQWYFWNTISAHCKIQRTQLLFYFFSIKHFIVIRIPGTPFKQKYFLDCPRIWPGITPCPHCLLAKVVSCNNGKFIQDCCFWREADKECELYRRYFALLRWTGSTDISEILSDSTDLWIWRRKYLLVTNLYHLQKININALLKYLITTESIWSARYP